MARKKIKNVLILTSIHFSLFISLLYIDDKEYGDTLFIIPKKYKKENIHVVTFRFKYLNILKKNYLNQRLKSYLYLLNNLYLRFNLFVKRILFYNISDANIYFNDFGFTVPVVYDFLEYKNAILVEDGLMSKDESFMIHNLNLKSEITLSGRLYQKLIGLPTLGNIKKYVSISKEYKRKIPVPMEFINIQEKWDNASEEKKKFILDFYNFDIDILKKYNNFSILCPQPLSEDNLISEEEKIDIYKRAIESVSKDEKIVIKPHPREKTDYTKIFPNAIVLSNSFPMELVKVSGLKFSKIYTVSSSVALNFPESEIVLIKVKQNNLFQDLIIQTLDNNGIKYDFI